MVDTLLNTSSVQRPRGALYLSTTRFFRFDRETLGLEKCSPPPAVFREIATASQGAARTRGGLGMGGDGSVLSHVTRD